MTLAVRTSLDKSIAAKVSLFSPVSPYASAKWLVIFLSGLPLVEPSDETGSDLRQIKLQSYASGGADKFIAAYNDSVQVIFDWEHVCKTCR